VLIAIHDEACGFLGGFGVNDAAELDTPITGVVGLVYVRLLIGNDAHSVTADASEAADHGLAVLWAVLVEVAVVDDADEDFLHVVLLGAVGVEDAVNLCGVVARRTSLFAIEDAELAIAHLVDQRTDTRDAGLVVRFAIVDRAADLGVHLGAA